MESKKKLAIGFISFIVLLWVLKKVRQRNVQKWIDAIEKTKGKALDLEQEENVLLIKRAFDRYGDGDQNKFAYILATSLHESRLKSVRECFAKTDKAAEDCVAWRWYGKGENKGYFGRGFPQLTLKKNYEKMGKELGIDLVKNPDRALDEKISARILVVGMMKGMWSLKKPLNYYINKNKVDFVGARGTVNGNDRDTLIAGYARDILKNLPGRKSQA